MTSSKRVPKLLNDTGFKSFNAIMGNPPYQSNTGGRNRRIYPEFYLLSTKLSEKVSLIFPTGPTGWQKGIGRATEAELFAKMRKDLGIVSIDNYEETSDSPVLLFPGVSTGGVSIVLWDSGHNDSKVSLYSHGVYQLETDLSKVRKWSEKTDQIYSKITNHFPNSISNSISGGNCFRVNSNWASDPNSKGNQYIYHEASKDRIKTWIRDRDNKYKWLYIDEEVVRKVNANKWKVVFPASGAYRVWRSVQIFKPWEIFSATFHGVFFDTEEEARGFATYLQTKVLPILTYRKSDYAAYFKTLSRIRS